MFGKTVNYAKLGTALFAGVAMLLSASFVGGEAQAQEATLKETHNDWEIRCFPDNNCFISQSEFNPDGSRAAAMNLIKLAQPVKGNGGNVVAIADVYTPLNVLLSQGLGLQVDAGTMIASPYTRCSQRGCLAKVSILDSQIEALKAGGQVNLFLVVFSEGKLGNAKVPFSLSGFTAAFDALQPVSAPKQ